MPAADPPDLSRRRRIWLRLWSVVLRGWPLAAGFGLAFLALFVYGAAYPPPEPLDEGDVDQIAVDIIASVTPPPSYASQVYQYILPSLVFIQTDRQDEEGEKGFAVGTGVVINNDAEVLTALHVVQGATEINLTFVDGSHVQALVVATEPEHDIAVLQPIERPGLIVPAVVGNPRAMRVGDEAYAVGNPFGLPGSMSNGVISGFDRALTPRGSDTRLEGLIQFDAAVNPGNSGGPLLNRAGHVIGIVTALANPTEQDFFIGIGFAVPINIAAGGGAGLPDY